MEMGTPLARAPLITTWSGADTGSFSPVSMKSVEVRRVAKAADTSATSPNYPDRHGRPQTIDDLGRHALIVYGRDGFVSPWLIADAADRSRKYAPRGRIVLGHGGPMLDAALAGCGITYLPTWLVANELASGRLECLLSHDLVETTPIHAIWYADADARAENPDCCR
jgi:DNA-binding transcriptional LysR family regulator